MLITVTMIFSR